MVYEDNRGVDCWPEGRFHLDGCPGPRNDMRRRDQYIISDIKPGPVPVWSQDNHSGFRERFGRHVGMSDGRADARREKGG
jgi:hypothetical protein